MGDGARLSHSPIRPLSHSSGLTSQHLPDDVPVDIGEAALGAVVVVGQFLMIEAEEGEDGGVEVVDRADVLLGAVAEGVGGGAARARVHAGAGHPGGEAEWVMVTAFAAGL